MYGIRIKLKSTTASYREPSSQLYHETLPIPTPSTIVGIAGAAMGLDYEDSMNYFIKSNIKVGCNGTNKGTFRDLWNYNKIKNKKVIKDIIVREFLFCNDISIFYVCDNKEIIDKLKVHFNEPVYAITLGNSDDLAFIKKIDFFKDIKIKKTKSNLLNTWIYKDCYSKVSINWDDLCKTKVSKTIQPPLIKKVPTVFTFDKNKVRSGKEYITMTYLNEYSILDEDIEVYDFGDMSIPLYSYGN